MKPTEIIENYEISYNKKENELLLTFAVEDALENIPQKNISCNYDKDTATLTAIFSDNYSELEVIFNDFPAEFRKKIIDNNSLWIVGLSEKVKDGIVFAKSVVLGSPIVNKSYKM